MTLYKQQFTDILAHNLLTGTSIEAGELRFITTELLLTDGHPRFVVMEFIIRRQTEESTGYSLFTELAAFAGKHSIQAAYLKSSKSKHIILFSYAQGDNLQSGSSSLPVQLLDTLQSTITEFEYANGIQVYSGIGSAVSDAGVIHESYKQASHASSYAAILGIREIMHYETIAHQRTDLFFYPVEAEMELLNMFNIKDISAIKQTLTAIINQNVYERTLDLFAAKCLMYEICATTVKGLQSLNRFSGRLDMERIEANCSLRDLPAYIANVVEEGFRETSTIDENTISFEVYRIIDQQYRNPKLTIKSIAEQLNTSTYVITKSVQIDLKEYMNRKKINAALQLLKESDYSIKEIASMSGFSDENLFIRVFKRFEEITPGQYRKERQC
jgi:AraC-like DNA-binding protein